MRSVLSTFLTIALMVLMSLGSSLTVSMPAQAGTMAPLPIAALPGVGAFTAGTRPDDIGVTEGKLLSCPASPNCVVSQDGDAEHAIAPIAYTTDRATALKNLTDILGVVPRTKIITQNDDYVLAESESRLMGFVDDSEFYFPKGEKVIQVRAAARLGESDLGVNRRRIEQIRLAFQDLEQRL
ncbi:MAG: DUF1499 domain-containing protein [Cyanobacteria bacterium J06634_5]